MPLSGDHEVGDPDFVDWANLVDTTIGGVQASVTSEATARASADSAEATARSNADTTEATARASGDTAVASAAASALASHEADTTNIHGIADTSLLLTQAAAAGAYQPIDSDLTAIAALTTTAYGRALLALADAAAGRTALGLGTAATSASGDFQPVDSDLTAIAALTTTAYGRALLALADGAAHRAYLGSGTPSSSNFLRGDGAWATPSGSATPSLTPASADYWVPQGVVGTTTNGFDSTTFYYQMLAAIPIYVPATTTYTGIACFADTSAASSNVRLGIYSPAASGRGPGALLLDAGLIASTATGTREITISQQLTTGLWWLVCVMQTTSGAKLRSVSTTSGYSNPFGLIPASAILSTAPSANAWTVSSTTGALPSTPTWTVANAPIPLVVLKV
jgi:hypothetical protein